MKVRIMRKCRHLNWSNDVGHRPPGGLVAGKSPSMNTREKPIADCVNGWTDLYHGSKHPARLPDYETGGPEVNPASRPSHGHPALGGVERGAGNWSTMSPSDLLAVRVQEQMAAKKSPPERPAPFFFWGAQYAAEPSGQRGMGDRKVIQSGIIHMLFCAARLGEAVHSY